MNEHAPIGKGLLTEFLGKVEAFSPFSAEELEYLAAHSQAMSYDLGDTILNAGEPAKGCI
ncbi:MAG: hypothetical protein HC887_09380 [Desulfobacteraceae bacterium]|nr:hypothetical protein [Desulfobacteraceae bacterium]